MDEKQTQETSNETVYVYLGGHTIDEDIIWKENGKEILFPKKRAGIGAIILKQNNEKNIMQPEIVMIYNGIQYRMPIRYAYFNNTLNDFKKGIDAGIFLFPRLDVGQNGEVSINEIGAGLFLSGRTVHSELAKLYLYNEKSNYFKLVRSENSYIVESLKNQGVKLDGFVYYEGFQGPIKIWEVSYPKNIKSNPDYLEIDFIDKKVIAAKTGEY